jgi:hypothetical protein
MRIIIFFFINVHTHRMGKICVFKICFSLMSILKNVFHSLWNEFLLIRIALIRRYRNFSSSEQNWIKNEENY